MLEQKQSPLWWTQNIRYFIYFIRELSGVIIAFAVMYFIFLPLRKYAIDTIVYPIWFYASVIHSLTWFWAMTKLAPFPPSLENRIILYMLILTTWAGISIIVFKVFFLS